MARNPLNRPKSKKAPTHSLARVIEHTHLKADATREQIVRLCGEARDHQFVAVCVNSVHVALCLEQLRNSDVTIVATAGFPFGAMNSAAKAYEAAQAVQDGAREIDMVLSIGDLKDQNYNAVIEDIRGVVNAVAPAPVKVILETSLLTDREKIVACSLAKAAAAAYVKTSTGFGSGGATVEDIKLMRSIVGPSMGIKAAGGIRDSRMAKALLDAGATRIGTSAGIAIVRRD